MKNVSLAFLVSVFTLTVITSSAQNKTFGVGATVLNPNAALQVDAVNQGLQLPRLTTAQRTAMTLDPVKDKGLMVFDTDLNGIHVWDGSKWVNNAKIPLPIDETLTNSVDGSSLFRIVNNGTATGNFRVAS